MSRRKQARPRHVDDPDLESPAISTNPVATAVFNDNVKEDDKVLTKPEEVEEEIEDHSGEVLPENRSPHTPNVDAHVCGKCRAEFLELDEFVSHKKQCCKPVVLLFKDDNEGQSMEKSAPKLYNGNVVNSCLSEDQDENNFDSDMSHNDHSDDEKDFENLTPAVDEIDAGGDQEKFGNQSDFDEDFDKSLDDDENDLDSLKGENPPEKPDKNGDIPPYMQPLSNLLPAVGTNPHSNVMLEPLEATKAAVAQFAENNLPEQEKDVTRLHSTLYNLQQQQIMQLQLIHQLQQQLVASGMQNSPLSAALLNSQIPLGTNFQGLNLNIPGLSSFQQSKNESPKSPSISESPSPKAEDQSAIENEKETPSEPSSPQHHSSETLALSSKTVVEVSKSSTLASSVSPPPPTSSSYKSEQNSTARSSPPTPALDYSRSSSKSGSEGQGYIGGDDPFFKHKCRLCHKVFGSDSALQIHVRSHTDTPHHAFFVDVPPLGLGAVLSTPDVWTWEKPFLCNICGGRFSTRGNLKVHFQRHKAEFPNVEMNPNPVPEHMDKNPMPLLGSPFPAAALTPFANPTFMGMQGLMNGFMFPPPHLAPRPPMPSMMPKHHHEERERRQSSPSGDMVSRHPAVKKEVSPSRSISEAHQRSSSDNRDSIKVSHTLSPSSAHMSKPSPAMPPIASIPLVSNYPVMSPLPSQYPYNQQRSQAPTSLASSDPYKPTILPSNVLDNDDSLEQFMEISKSETSKLQQLVDNIEHKLTDPNQCVICHRVLSCKSALQMHYRIHTGERPFKCKICGRSFTTKGNLKTHMGVHRAKPPLRMMHQCPVCHKQFTNLLVLQQHIRSHTGMSSLPMMPSLSHLNMYGRQNMDAFHESPLNMKRQFPEDHERELDLSKKPRLVDENKVAMEHLRQGVEVDEHNDDVSDIDDDDDNEQNEMDDEANKLAAKDAKKEGLKREDSEGRSTPGDSSDGMETKPDETDDRPKSNQSDDRLGFTDSIPRSSSPKYLQEDSNMSQEGSYNAYSTSLAALEERVRAIDSTMARNPLSQFHAAPFLLAPNHYTNGDRALSPRSESGSDSGEKKPLTPALSVSSNGSIDNNFMIGAMDVRAHMDSKTSTTCNVCYKTFACRSALDIHYRSHTRERPYKCDMCDKSFTTRGNMRQHLLTHKLDGTDGSELENNNNSCTPNQNDNDSDRSGNSSPFAESPQEKMRKDLNESQGSVSKKDVTLSEKSATSLSSPPSISTVTPSRSSSSAYTSPSDNQSPFISKTPTVKHQCLVCQKGFSSASALQIHIRTHTGDKPFKCTVCGKAFTTKGNLKVHMGTHMWNNSPSRRGRRMSIEPPFMLAHKENPYLPHGFPPRPDFYPFQFPPFMNGLPTPPKSLSEISVIPGMTSGMGMKPELMSPHADLGRTKSDSSPIREEKPKFAESGELDLSMKSTGSSGSRSSEKTSPSSIDSNSSSGMVSPPHMSLGWGWKASCHLCSRSFPTPAALEHHVRSMHMVGDSLPKVAAS